MRNYKCTSSNHTSWDHYSCKTTSCSVHPCCQVAGRTCALEMVFGNGLRPGVGLWNAIKKGSCNSTYKGLYNHNKKGYIKLYPKI